MAKSFPVFWKGYERWAVSQSAETLADLEMDVLGDLDYEEVTIEQLTTIVHTTTGIQCKPEALLNRLAGFRKFAKMCFALQSIPENGSILGTKTIFFVPIEGAEVAPVVGGEGAPDSRRVRPLWPPP